MAKDKIKNIKIHESFGDRVVDWVTGFILVLVVLVVGYPLVYVVSCSFSSSRALEVGSVILWPVEPCLEAYDFVFAYKQVWIGFRNSVLYCAWHVLFDMTGTILVAYPLSRAYLQGRRFYTMFFYLTTRVGAGLIPSFILRCDLGFFDTVWAVLINGLVSVTDILILRTAINSSIPAELHDAAMIDGANHFQTVFKLVIPLTKATLSVLCLYCIVAQWNDYFNAMLYLRNKNLFPLQLVLQPIMTAATTIINDAGSLSSQMQQQQANQGLENVRYAMIVISTVPVVAAYFFVQKYFKGGVMMGSVKG